MYTQVEPIYLQVYNLFQFLSYFFFQTGYHNDVKKPNLAY